jgi:hypothetical protein
MRSLYIYAKSGQEGENERKVLAALASLGENYDVLLVSRYLVSLYHTWLSQVPLPRDTERCQDRQVLAVWAPPLIASLLLALAILGLTQAGHLLRQVFCRPSPEPIGISALT